MKKEYVLGFAFTGPGARGVTLIEKKRPDWQAGRLNGIGGKLEPGEHTLDAMVREFREETGVQTDPTQWKFFCQLEGGDWRVFCYKTMSLPSHPQTMTDEYVQTYALPLRHEHRVIMNLHWLIPLALDSDNPVGVVTQD